MNGKYHKEIGFPQHFAITHTVLENLTYSKHAQESAKNDRYGAIKLYTEIWFEFADVFEIKIENNKLIKFAFRIPYNEFFDISYVYSTQYNKIITLWLNEKDDNHLTLNPSLYDKP